MEVETSFTSLRGLSRILGLPSAWLRDEAEAGRIPCLKAGRRPMFNVQAVEAALLARAGQSTNERQEAAHAR